MNETRCPNCNGELHLSTDKTQLICEYCDSAFSIDNDDSVLQGAIEEDDINKLIEKYLDIRIRYLNDKTSETLNTLGNLIYYNNTIDDYMKGINIVAKSNNNFATQVNSSSVLMTAVKNTQGYLLSDEAPLAFINKGLLSKGKDGILITDKAILRITKKSISKLNIQDICSLNATPEPYSFSSWYINNDDKFDLGFTFDDNRITAIILGLICELANNCHSEDYRVIIDNQK